MASMPFVRLDFFTSDVGRAAFVLWAFVLVVCHMRSVEPACT